MCVLMYAGLHRDGGDGAGQRSDFLEVGERMGMYSVPGTGLAFCIH